MNALLIIASIAIYASFGWQSLFYVFFSIIITFFAAKFLNKKYKKAILIGTITINAALLFFIKVLPYTEISIIAPLGISYYTLQIISYLVDVYKGKYEAEDKFWNFVLFIMYIPHLFIGPISRYDDMKKTLLARKKITANNFFDGLLRVCWGLIKKFVIAGRAAILIATISGNPEYSGAYALLAMLIYSINIYADFSGGIDIVMGVSKMLGIDLKENFDSPYYSESFKEFWRRWHISLSSWLRDYIYIPLGGNRKGTLRKNINLLITFIVSGIWHGFNYIIWGVLNGIFVMFGDRFKTKSKIFNRTIMFILISFLWSFFIWQDQLLSLQMMGSVFTTFNYADLGANFLSLGLSFADWIVLGVFTIALFAFDGNKEKIIPKLHGVKLETKTVFIGIMALIVAVLGIYGIGFEVSNFIYSKF